MIYNDDVFNILPKIESCSQNLVYSDFPYNLGTTMIVADNGKVEAKGKAVDFMNNKWEGLTGENFEVLFNELFRVLKYGGYCCVWGLNRQSLAPMYYANKAGFEQLQSINSFFISSFPKAMDLSKALMRNYNDEGISLGLQKGMGKQNPSFNGIEGGRSENFIKPEYESFGATHPIAKKYDGYKSSIVPLKEVSETLLVFRKPFKYKQIIQDIIAKEENNESDIHGCGINIDGNRVGFDKQDYDSYKKKRESFNGVVGKAYTEITGSSQMMTSPLNNITQDENGGRYPSNLYLIDGFNYTPEQIKEILTNKQLHIFENIGIDIEPLEYMTEEKQIEYICNYLDKFEVSKILDEQRGNLKSGDDCVRTKVSDSYHGNFGKSGDIQTTYGDEGGCSRILHKSLYEMEEFNIFNYCTKVNSHEREAMISKDIKEKSFGQSNQAKAEILRGNEVFKGNQNGMNNVKQLKNNHPCLKSMSLQHKILNLFLPPKEDIKDFKILIPFCGVQSEYMSAMALGIPEENITGIEISKEYCEIGEARKAYWTKHNFYFKEDKKEANELKENAIKKDSQITGKKLF